MRTQLAHTVAAGLTAFAALAPVGCSVGDSKVSESTPAPADARRGEYLVRVVGCSDCHTPMKMGPQGPEPDMSRFLSGHPEHVGPLPAAQAQGPWLWAGAATNTAFAGPWGVSYAANLTPDQNTGL